MLGDSLSRGAGTAAIPHTGYAPAAAELRLPLAGWCAWGLEDVPAAPDVAFIEPLLRRRLSPLARSALAVAHRTRPDPAPTRFVFASRHGELKRNAEMLQELAAGQVPSPMNFSLSVLNAVAGLFGIVRGDRSASSAVSAGRATLPLALLEGAMQAWAYPAESVLVVFADEPPPALYEGLVAEPARPHAIAIALQAGSTGRAFVCRWAPSDDAPESERPALDALVDCLQHGAEARWVGPDHVWQWEPVSPLAAPAGMRK